MKRIFWSVPILFACVFAAQAQSRPVKVHLHVILVDSELNQKPVPFLNVTLKGAATSSGVKTGLDGAAETTLPPGAYTVTTAKPVDFAGKRYSWSLRVTLTGVEKTIDLTNENAKEEENDDAGTPRSSGASSGDLTEQFKKLKNTVVTVISESGHGTGFFVDGKGLILTNQHVVAQSQYLAVQFDREHKIAARLIASDAQKDVALLWANMSALPSATSAVLARSSGSHAPVQEGERVFTIGSPLTLDKIITTGIISKVDAHTIMSDININPGNSGGPLFNNAGHVVGLTTFGTSADRGPGVSGVVRIEEALALLEENRGKATGAPPPGTLLPVEPLTPYPVEGLNAALRGEKFDPRPYYLNAGDFEIALSTPPFDYREKEEDRLRAERTQKKRNRRDTSNADAAAIVTALPRRIAVFGRKSLFDIPIVGYAFRLAHFVPVDRGNRESALESVRLATEYTKSGSSFLVYPEGTRSADGRLSNFKKGSFMMAIESGIPVVPVACVGAHRVMKKKSLVVHPGQVVVRFGPPIDASKYAVGQRADLAVHVHDAVAALLPADQKPVAWAAQAHA